MAHALPMARARLLTVWEVPVLGGEPHIMLPNASSLTWIERGKRLLFSEIKEGLHMVVVTTDLGRGQRREVYAPPGDRSMAHHSYLSPDRRWVLVVEMDNRGNILTVPGRSVRGRWKRANHGSRG